jgi:hypothetical protein
MERRVQRWAVVTGGRLGGCSHLTTVDTTTRTKGTHTEMKLEEIPECWTRRDELARNKMKKLPEDCLSRCSFEIIDELRRASMYICQRRQGNGGTDVRPRLDCSIRDPSLLTQRRLGNRLQQ